MVFRLLKGGSGLSSPAFIRASTPPLRRTRFRYSRTALGDVRAGPPLSSSAIHRFTSSRGAMSFSTGVASDKWELLPRRGPYFTTAFALDANARVH